MSKGVILFLMLSRFSAVVVLSSCRPCSTILPLVATGHELCTESARPQDWDLSRLLCLNSVWSACSFLWFSCDSNFFNWPAVCIWPALLLLIFVCYNYSFIQIAVTGSYSKKWDEIFTTLKYWGNAEKHWYESRGLRSGDGGPGTEEHRHGAMRGGYGRLHSCRQLTHGQLKKCRLGTGQNGL